MCVFLSSYRWYRSACRRNTALNQRVAYLFFLLFKTGYEASPLPLWGYLLWSLGRLSLVTSNISREVIAFLWTGPKEVLLQKRSRMTHEVFTAPPVLFLWRQSSALMLLKLSCRVMPALSRRRMKAFVLKCWRRSFHQKWEIISVLEKTLQSDKWHF